LVAIAPTKLYELKTIAGWNRVNGKQAKH